MRLAVVIGHNAREQGAVRVDTGESEWTWNDHLANIVHEMAKDEYTDIVVKGFYRQHSGSYSREISKVYAEVDAWGADASLELHFNAAADRTANGCEMLSSGSRGSMQIAEAVQREVLAAFPSLRDRGVKVLGPSDNGYGALHAGKAPAVILEPFFGSSPKDCAAIKTLDHKIDYAEAILNAVEAVGQEWGLLDIQAANPPAQKLDAPTFWTVLLQFLKGWKK